MKIIDIRKTQSQGWVADVMLSPLSILPVSIPVSQCNPFDLMDYADNDAEHIRYGKPLAKVIICKSFAEQWTNEAKDYREHYRTNNVVMLN